MAPESRFLVQAAEVGFLHRGLARICSGVPVAISSP
jgi:hypothetical protein